MAVDREILLVGGKGIAFTTLAAQFKAVGGLPVAVAGPAEAKARLGGGQGGMARMVVVAVESLPEPLETLRELAFLYRGLPVVAAAEKGSVHQAREAIAVGAADYLLLPVDQPVVAEMFKQYANRANGPELGRGRRLLTADEGMRRLLNQVRRVAKSKATVLIQGESGTGKELFARYIHQVSDRAEGPFVAVNCAALPENLLESELFGHARGAFTGATQDRKGKFQSANGGTILLDEISEMSLALQAKLLRVLQEGEVDPVGGRSPVSLDVRVIASTNRDLKQWSEEGRFREDLFYRLNVFPLLLPALRQRPGDILLLAESFRTRFVEEFGRNDIAFSQAALRAMKVYDWPGNVRELENIVQRALLIAEGQEVTVADLMIAPVDAGSVPMEEEGGGDVLKMPVGTTVREMEEILIRRTLDEVNGNRTRAAELLGISIRTLRNKLNEYSARDQ